MPVTLFLRLLWYYQLLRAAEARHNWILKLRQLLIVFLSLLFFLAGSLLDFAVPVRTLHNSVVSKAYHFFLRQFWIRAPFGRIALWSAITFRCLTASLWLYLETLISMIEFKQQMGYFKICLIYFLWPINGHVCFYMCAGFNVCVFDCINTNTSDVHIKWVHVFLNVCMYDINMMLLCFMKNQCTK